MNPSYYRLSLDVHDATSQLSFPIKKGDTSRRLLISLVDNGVPYIISEDCYAIFMAKKPDGNLISNDCTIQNNMIIYDITGQTSAMEGRLDCEITLFGLNAGQITSPRFSMIVYETTGSEAESEITSSSEYKSLVHLIAEGNDLVYTVKKKLEHGEFVGEQGEAGKTPVRGVDYFTEADKKDITDYIDKEIAEFDFVKVVDTLPKEGLPNREYFVRKGNPGTNDLFDEYSWINKGTEEEPDWDWEFKGTKKFEVDFSDVVKLTDRDQFVKEGVTENGVSLTDVEKASACGWLGAIKNPKPSNNSLIAVVEDLVSTISYTNYMPYDGKLYVLASENEGDTIVGSGYFLVNDPKKPYHAANKKYVDNIANTNEEWEFTLEDGSIVTKTVAVKTTG